MTMLEFEAWVSDHYDELAARTSRVRADVDVLHTIIERLLEQPERIEGFEPNLLMGWFTTEMGRRGIDAARRSGSVDDLNIRLGQSLKALGTDTFVELDPIKDSIRKKRLTRNVRVRPALDVKTRPAHTCHAPDRVGRCQACTWNQTQNRRKKMAEKIEGLQINWITGPCGNVRWRFQQMRDGRLFDERAVRSLAESMHRASHRYRHFGEHGFAFSEFGQEVSS